MSVLYFVLGAMCGTVLGFAAGRSVRDLVRSSRPVAPGESVDELTAAWLAEPAPVCVACRLGECAEHRGAERPDSGAS